MEANKKLLSLSKFFLGLLEDLRADHDEKIEKGGESLIEIEETLSEKYKIEMDLGHLAKHFEFFTEKNYLSTRKKITDFAENLKIT